MEAFTRPPIEVICYTAGLLDAGGSIYWVESQSQFSFTLTQATTDRCDGEATIRWLQSAWGVGRVSVKQIRTWKADGSKRVYWIWTVSAAKELHFVLSTCFPYLHSKSGAAAEAIEYITQRLEAGKSKWYRWTPNEDDYILNADASPQQMAEHLGRSVVTVTDRLERLRRARASHK